jgi:ubiquinone/menaquinone biosynthesis C-methylase UbiE
MTITSDPWLSGVESCITLKNKRVIEIGCGDGFRSTQIIAKCGKDGSLTGFDIDEEKINIARRRDIKNAGFICGDVATCPLFENECDIAIFTLSFHHLSPVKMNTVVTRVVYATRKEGYIIFLEPGTDGTLFDAEITFDAWDGDERRQKEIAYATMHNRQDLKLVSEFRSETMFRFESMDDFTHTMTPKKNLDLLKAFLDTNNYVLRAERRVSIFQPVK